VLPSYILDSDIGELFDRLGERLQKPLPGVKAHLSMAPAYRSDPAMFNVRDKPCREAAVLALLYPDDAGTMLVLTQRPQHLASHAGQISFPGGRREDGETFIETALREAHEEVGLKPASVRVIGELTPLYIPPSNFCAHPIVGGCDHRPDLYPADGEVASIIHIPLRTLFDQRARIVTERHVRDATIQAPCFFVHPHEIWGATAMMLAEFVAVLGELGDRDRSEF
jgi:8-oxo-dGTP pyrophosphatase MutT (NUDIX family)